MIVRASLRGRELAHFESKLTAVGFGFLIPFFFVESGLTFDLDALGSASAMLKLVLFFVLFLVVRGTPAMLFYRGALDFRERSALAIFCATELPLVVAITTLATESDKMTSSTAAGLVGAAIVSTLVYPFIGLALRRKGGEPAAERSRRAGRSRRPGTDGWLRMRQRSRSGFSGGAAAADDPSAAATSRSANAPRGNSAGGTQRSGSPMPSVVLGAASAVAVRGER